MQPKVLGDMDCIAIESCGIGGCGPTTELFSVTFNWGADSVTVEADGATHDLPWASSSDSEDSLASVLEYGNMEDTDRLLRIEAQGDDILAFYTFKTASVTTLVGTCDVRKAA